MNIECAIDSDIDCSLNTDNAWVRASLWVFDTPLSVQMAIGNYSDLEFLSVSDRLSSMLSEDDYAMIIQVITLWPFQMWSLVYASHAIYRVPYTLPT